MKKSAFTGLGTGAIRKTLKGGIEMKKSAFAGLGTGGIRKTLFALAVGVSLTMVAALLPIHVQAQEEIGDYKPWRDYYKAMKGKTVGFVPMALSFDIAQAYDGSMRERAKALGYKYLVRDPNWSVESAVQIAEQYIAEKVDIMVIHPFDDKAFNRVVHKAKAAGIYTIFMNLRQGVGTDALDCNVFIGADHYSNAKKKVDLAWKLCEKCPSKKIALIQVPLTDAVAIAETNGTLYQLKKYPELKLVAKQSADADANKAKAIVSTILKQHPDLCVIIGQWDGQDVSIMAAVAEAGLKGKVAVITSGSGSQTNCGDKVADGTYTAYFNWDIATQCQLLNATIAQIFQTMPDVKAKPYQLYIDSYVVTKDTLAKTPCSSWNLSFVTRPLD